MSAIEIKPCIFCGHDDVELDETSPGEFRVTCPECGAMGPVSDTGTQGAILHWNIRQPELTA